ncbi:assimilatory sulfite reductase (NADPH) flavoprotein subunit [Cyclobacterium jeungdonense]|uniref:Assimilatory sulfite reductase (NADPH) flavoprotein subunit n=1 Tax=Cyclobacterium jeungdonense TaxID=708087 RepID=A0ABT8C6Y6_9BACT|nr:assimilatory sulfite reductase (NADPH) flavoprotein subunit [Cyclobacterium jeungdonense]MDN3688568.1 assimilatory sulfite reductase (NADPH) flavoprotein subunit [Cyclobacterium jeungdonense]
MDIKKGLERGPFNDTQAEKLNEALSGLDSGQLQWLSGFFSGIGQVSPATIRTVDQQPVASKNAASESQAEKLSILFGSHTGNSEGLAYSLASKAKEMGIETEVSDMASFKPRNLKKITNLAVIVSTHGLGEPPVQAEDLYNFLHSKKAPDLSHVRFSVLALGDSSYVDFCQTGKDFDNALGKLGAQRVISRQDCDVDYEEEAQAWQQTFLQRLSKSVDAGSTGETQINTAVPVKEQKYSRNNPFEATILEKVRLNGRGSSKENIHLELDLEGSGLQYEPGDALGVYGANPPLLIEKVLGATNLSGNEKVQSHKGEKSLKEALTYDYELTPLSRVNLSKYEELTGSKKLKEVLSDNMKILEYLPGRDFLDLLEEEPHTFEANELLSVLRKNTPRMYSIASSQDAVENEVHLCVSVVRYSAFGRQKEGHCSTTLADRLQVDDKVKVFVDKNSRFKLPTDPETPVIMVGPGTGVAPFRAFMQHREVSEKKGPSWLFFGDRNFTTDFLYQTEWQQYLKEGILTKADVAFSRDQEQRYYVQHRMMEKGKELYDWLEKGAHFYVCGDAKKMAKDVDMALREIIQQQGGVTPEKAEEYVKYLQVSKRYQSDVY